MAMRNIPSLDMNGGGKGRNWLGKCCDMETVCSYGLKVTS